MLFRQGDVLVRRVEIIPDGKEIQRDEHGRLVLAYGEVTGHSHAIMMSHVRMIESTKARVLVADAPFEIVHEEHHPLVLPAGIYETWIQREYTPSAIRSVID